MAQFAITLTRAQLRAALIFAAEKDVRYYLNGICLEVGECGDARLVATDGHRLAVLAIGDHPDAVPGEYLIPRDVLKPVKRASRATGADVSLQIDGGRVVVASGADIIAGGLLIDGKFPDWQRVCPDPETMSGEPGCYNAAYLADIRAALIELGDKYPVFEMIPQGQTGPALMIDPVRQLMVATMPIRGNGFVPTRGARDHFLPRRPVFSAVVETAAGGQAFPYDPAQDVSDKRRPLDIPAAPDVVAHCTADIAAWIDPSGTLQAAGLLIVEPMASGEDEAAPSEAPASGEAGNPPGTSTVYIVDAAGKPYFRTTCATAYHSAEIRNMGRKLEAARANPAAFSFLDLKTARIVAEHASPVDAIDDDELLAALAGEPMPSGEVVAEACPTLIPGRWIPGGAENAERIAFDAALGAEVWLIASTARAGALAVIAYAGKRMKRDAYYTMRDRAQALQWAGEYMGKLQAAAQRQAERRMEKAAKRAAGHKLKPGDVLRCSWGYDQTNIDYYEVTRLIGARMVEIRAIGAESVESGSMTGECVPRHGHYIGEPMRKAVSDYDGQSVRIASYASAHKIEPREVGGVKVYPVDHWTAYA